MKKLVMGAVLLAVPQIAFAAEDTNDIIVTATRAPEPALEVPAVISIVSGEAAREQGAFDLRSALASAAGIQDNPGGDGGPAGGIVAAQGLAEIDAYLLVMDGVPYGGAFNPATATLDLIDVDRIEVLRGAAPVTYGSTAFVGVLNVIRYAAGKQPTRAIMQGGTHNSGRIAFATNLPQLGKVKQSLLGSVETRRFSQDRGGFDRAHLLYRAATETSVGKLHLDIDATHLEQTPYSPHPREGTVLSVRFPIDANVNPIDAKQDQDRFQANIGLEAKIGNLDWTTTASIASTTGRTVRGFLREGFVGDGVTINADGFRQRVHTTDLYFDTHIDSESAGFDWVVGADVLHGNGNQRSANFEYAVRPDGADAPASTTRAIDESTALTDRRTFAGLYAQTVLRPVSNLTLLAGIRLNRTTERRCGGELVGAGQPSASDCTTRSKTRLVGSIGGSYAVWKQGDDAIALFADYRNTYKPAAIDFGPEAEADILQPETARGWETGVKAAFADGKINVEASYFDTRFTNLVIRENVSGLPALANAGRERFRGFEIEGRYAVTPSLSLVASYARHIARFTDYARLRPNGSVQQLAGNQLELSPKDLATAIVTFAPKSGPQASATLRYVGARFLNKGNTVLADGYVTLDGRIGWKLNNGWGLFVEAENLTNRRDAVAESELGDAQFYRLPGRRLLLTASYGF
jgi:iron complex outermembrane recepter protein